MAIQVNDQNGQEYSLELDRFPDYCPSCKQRIHPIYHSAFLNFIPDRGGPGSARSILRVIFRCPSATCLILFQAQYSVIRPQYAGATAHLSGSLVLNYTIDAEFPRAVREISPHFKKIYNQALQAEENGLNEICGPGYRKALEYLVKDYLIKYAFKDDPAKQKEVAASPLGACIEKHIEEKRIRAAAKLAAWLGNDETHYIKKWADKDLSDLKTLISMTVNWIDLVVQSDKYDSAMNPDQKKLDGT